MSNSKIQIKIGAIEFSGEGNQDWLAKQLDKVLAKAPELANIAPQTSNPDLSNEEPVSGKKKSVINLSMVNMATKLGANSGADLAVAAAAFLRFVQGKASFTRDEILKNMKDATGVYRGTYSNNLTKILFQLVKNNSFTQSSGNVYSLHHNKEKEINGLLSK